jgi:hypothetical protein
MTTQIMQRAGRGAFGKRKFQLVAKIMIRCDVAPTSDIGTPRTINSDEATSALTRQRTGSLHFNCFNLGLSPVRVVLDSWIRDYSTRLADRVGLVHLRRR